MAKNGTQAFSNELLDQLLAGCDPKTILDTGGLIGEWIPLALGDGANQRL